MLRAARQVWSRYATFSGRASRPEFWWWSLAFFLLLCTTWLLDGYFIAPAFGEDQPWGRDALQPLTLIVSLVLLLPNLSVSVRRLHDTDRSGWWVLINLIPLIGLLVLIYFFAQPSERGINRFGEPDPLKI